MVTVTKRSVADLLLVDTLAEAHGLRERVTRFKRKYGCSVDVFEQRLAEQPESFEGYDDLMEWKACSNALVDVEARVDLRT